jgi:hypothetical protein
MEAVGVVLIVCWWERNTADHGSSKIICHVILYDSLSKADAPAPARRC